MCVYIGSVRKLSVDSHGIFQGKYEFIIDFYITGVSFVAWYIHVCKNVVHVHCDFTEIKVIHFGPITKPLKRLFRNFIFDKYKCVSVFRDSFCVSGKVWFPLTGLTKPVTGICDRKMI